MNINKSTSRIIKWEIKNVTKDALIYGAFVNSSSFEIPFDGKVTKWYLTADIIDKDLEVHLFMNEPDISHFSTKYEFNILTIHNTNENHFRDLIPYGQFTSGSGYGSQSLISVNNLLKKLNKYLKNEVLTIEAKVELFIKGYEKLDEPSTASKAELPEVYQHYFETKSLSDITIACSDDVKIMAHRIILAAASPTFKELIDLQPRVIEVKDIDSDDMTEILRYIYTGKVNNIDNCARKLVYGAVKYQIRELIELCGTTMMNNLSVENVVDYFLLADQYGINGLSDRCMQFIKLNYQTVVLNRQSWEKLDKKHLEMILDHFCQHQYILLESSFF